MSKTTVRVWIDGVVELEVEKVSHQEVVRATKRKLLEVPVHDIEIYNWTEAKEEGE